MNFKELYKSANDSIHGDRTLLDNIYSQPKKCFAFNYKRASLCAAALVIVAFAVYPKFDFGTDTDYRPNQDVVLNETNNKLKENKNSNVQEDVPTFDIHNKKTTYESESHALKDDLVKEDNINAHSSDSSLPTSRNSAMQEESIDSLPMEKSIDINESVSETDTNEIAVASDNHNQTEKGRTTSISASLGGGGGSASGGSSVRILKTMLRDEYSQYLGFDITTVIPSLVCDIEFNIPDTFEFAVNPRTGDITDDTVQIVGTSTENPAKFAAVALSKKDLESEKIFQNNSANQKNINGYAVVVLNQNNLNYAYYNYNGVWITISSAEISKDEFDIILQTIIK